MMRTQVPTTAPQRPSSSSVRRPGSQPARRMSSAVCTGRTPSSIHPILMVTGTSPSISISGTPMGKSSTAGSVSMRQRRSRSSKDITTSRIQHRRTSWCSRLSRHKLLLIYRVAATQTAHRLEEGLQSLFAEDPALQIFVRQPRTVQEVCERISDCAESQVLVLIGVTRETLEERGRWRLQCHAVYVVAQIGLAFGETEIAARQEIRLVIGHAIQRDLR